MPRSLLLLLLPFLLVDAHAQSYGNVWQFGDHVGLDFKDCAPLVITTGNNDGFEGCSTVCGGSGQVLFYTNGATVWNGNDAPMPNGMVGSNGGTLSQVVIVRKPLSTSLYYIVTTTVQGSGPGALAYHVVDMSADGGLGDVISTNNVLFTGTSTEHVAATLHANGSDVWIMAHAYPANEFLAYLLTSNGIDGAAVVSAAGPVFASCNSNINTRGEITITIDGSRLAMAGNGVGEDDATNSLGLYHFDNSTGVVTEELQLPYGRGDFGLSFSADGSKLYGATWKALNFSQNDSNIVYQFDLSSNDPATIIASRQVLFTCPVTRPFGALKLGPDGRIYASGAGRTSLGVINHPDLAGAACDYVDDGLFLEGATCSYGLSNYVEYVNCAEVPTRVASVAMEDVSVFPNPSLGSITVQVSGANAARTVRVIDATGRVVRAERMPLNGILDLAGLVAGGYRIAVCDADGTVLVSKAVVVVR